jgi:hypothetical protein
MAAPRRPRWSRRHHPAVSMISGAFAPQRGGEPLSPQHPIATDHGQPTDSGLAIRRSLARFRPRRRSAPRSVGGLVLVIAALLHDLLSRLTMDLGARRRRGSPVGRRPSPERPARWLSSRPGLLPLGDGPVLRPDLPSLLLAHAAAQGLEVGSPGRAARALGSVPAWLPLRHVATSGPASTVSPRRSRAHPASPASRRSPRLRRR